MKAINFVLDYSAGIKMRNILLIGFFFICDKTTSTAQRHVVSMAPKNWKLGECSELLKLTVFGR